MNIILDYGHGGLHPTTGQYVTAGKRMVKDGIEFYEGVNNRIVGEMVKKALEAKGHTIIETAHTWIDVKLWERVKIANEVDDAILISIHSDAHGNGREWSTANGMGCFIYNGTLSSKTMNLVDSLNNALICNFDGIAKNRGIKKRNFAILKSKHPSVLLELGFHTNKEEVQKMLTDDWKQRIVKSIVEAVDEYQLKIK